MPGWIADRTRYRGSYLFLFGLAAFGWMLAEGQAFAQVPTTQPIHERILWMKNPAHEAVVSWSTRAPGLHHRVHYDTQPRGGHPRAYAHHARSFSDGRFTMPDSHAQWVSPAFYHHVHLSDLEPDTTYYLVIASDNHISQEFHFRTAPDRDQPFKIIFGGDSRLGSSDPGTEHNDRQAMNRRIAQLLEEHPDILAFAHGGDYCMSAQWRYLDGWLTEHELVRTADGRLLPIIPARGNHDRDIGFEEVFRWPNMENNYYYATRLSPAVTLITLNTEISTGGNQRDWLRATLAEERDRNRWLFVQYHRTAFSSARDEQYGESRRRRWVPLFEQYNVDLVCESHDHTLKRTIPIRDNAHDPENGIIYIGDGGLGVPQRRPNPDHWWFQGEGAVLRRAHHVHLLEFYENRMRVRAIGMNGRVLDNFTLSPRFAEMTAP